MKIKHRVPAVAHFVTEPVSERYQAEVDRSTAKGERREQDAQRRLAAAESRLVKAQRIKAAPQRAHAVAVAAELVELRRQELLTIQREMSGTPSSGAHRGRGHGSRPVPNGSTL